jgi:hypothetical protein
MTAAQTILFKPPARFLPRMAESITGSLSEPAKMPGHAWGISPSLCKVGQQLAKVAGSVCADCYAEKGRYTWPATRKAHAKRAAGLASIAWRDAMVYRIARTGDEHFRWLDAGDLQSLQMLLDVVWIAEQLPRVGFWLPTRERGIVAEYIRTFGAFPPNLVVRVSAAMIDGAPPAGFLHTSGVHRNEPPRGRECPSPTQGGKCGDCRACWNPRVKHVSYRWH